MLEECFNSVFCPTLIGLGLGMLALFALSYFICAFSSFKMKEYNLERSKRTAKNRVKYSWNFIIFAKRWQKAIKSGIWRTCGFERGMMMLSLVFSS